MYPIYIMERGVELPKSGIYYVVAGNGIFMHKDIGVFNAFVPVPAISFLAKVSPWATHKLPKIPVELISQFLAFAKDVFERYKSEAVILLYYSLEKREYRLICPGQRAFGVWIDYKRNIGVGGFRQIGTIHSHPDFNAYHSAIDEDDENGFDGVHITLGNVDEPCFSCSVELAINGARFKLSPESIIEGIRQIENAGIELLESSLEPVLAAEKVKPSKVEKQKRYQLFNEAVQFIESTIYPKEWLDNVGGIIGKDEFDDFEEEVKNGDQSHRLRRHRLLSFTLFGKVFTLSIQRQR